MRPSTSSGERPGRLTLRQAAILSLLALAAFLAASLVYTARAQAPVEILNVSCNPTRELYADFDAAVAKRSRPANGVEVIAQQSHRDSGAQARPVTPRK